MRKAIIKWLLGTDWEEYWDLHHKYICELTEHKKSLEQNKELMEDLQELRGKLIKEIDSELRTSKLALKVLEVNEKLEHICKENGIDTENI